MTLVAQRPAEGPPRPWRFPRFDDLRVGGGRVLAAHLPGKPVLTLMAVVDAGAVAEPAGQEGLAALTARLLGEGTEERDAYGFALAGERLGASWDADVWWDSMRVGFDVPAAGLEAAVGLLAEALRRPRFAEEDVLRLRADVANDLRMQLTQPGSRAADAFGRELWASGNRYAVRDVGDPATVEALTLDDVRTFHAGRFSPAATTLVVAGDLAGVDVAALASGLYDGWTAEAPVRSTVEPTERGGGARVLVVDRPGSVQSMLYVGHAAPPRRTPDHVALTTAGVALGGVFNSRLNHHLREVKGYTYGAFAGFELRRDGGQFSARAAVQTPATVDATVDTVAEIRRFVTDGIGAEELAGVRSYRAGVYPVAFASAHAVAGALGDLVVHDLPADYFDRTREELATVSAEQVDTAIRARLHPDELLTVVVGDHEAFAGPLAEAGLGPVTAVRD